MILQRALSSGPHSTNSRYSLAYAEDIPGTRCGPEDGPWPRAYEVLEDEDIWRELSVLAKPQSMQFDASQTRSADSINFQPCARARTQDRCIVQQLDVHGRLWTLTGVFDGHLGDTTVEHVAFHLPIIIKDFLCKAFQDNPTRKPSRDFVTDLLSRSIVAFDNAIADDVLNLFPGGLAGLSALTNEEIRNTINDQHLGGANWNKTKLCMYGTTALVALVNPENTDLWVANVGDCQAILVSPGVADGWEVEVLTVIHNGDNDAEIARVRREHPGEPECVLDGRVLGALAPTRCLGDVPFKQPPEFTRRILYNLLPGFYDTSPWEEFLVLNRTPPYISAQPEITHHCLDALPTPRYLILCSDGFSDLCSCDGTRRVVTSWAQNMVGQKADAVGNGNAGNMALRLLRQVLGWDDRYSVSKVLTLDMDVAWIDDTSIVVQRL